MHVQFLIFLFISKMIRIDDFDIPVNVIHGVDSSSS